MVDVVHFRADNGSQWPTARESSAHECTQSKSSTQPILYLGNLDRSAALQFDVSRCIVAEARKKPASFRYDWLTPNNSQAIGFGVALPILNEETDLEACLGTIVFQRFPSDRPIVIVAVINGDRRNRDESESIFRRFCARHWEIGLPEYPEKRTPADSVSGSKRNLTVFLVDLEAPGRWNAVNVASKIIADRCLDIAFAVDSDCIYAPHSFRKAYNKAVKYLVQERHENWTVGGVVQTLQRDPKQVLYRSNKWSKTELLLSGAFSVYNPRFHKLAESCTEDRNMLIDCLTSGGKLIRVNAKFWRKQYSPGDALNAAARAKRGALMLKHHYGKQSPSWKKAQEIWDVAMTAPMRFLWYFRKAVNNPSRSALVIAEYLLREASYVWASYEYFCKKLRNGTWKQSKTSRSKVRFPIENFQIRLDRSTSISLNNSTAHPENSWQE